MSTQEKLLVTLDDAGVKRITFNRPERRNAIDFELFALFADAIAQAAEDESRVVVITGAGDSFSAGLDLASINPNDLATMDVAAKIRELINPPILQMRRMSKPIIARVHGSAVGIGFSYALASDICIATEESAFSQSFIRVGLMPDGGSTYFLPRLVGTRRAFELMTTGAQISARDAMQLGLINQVVAAGELDAVVNQLAATLAQSPQPSLARVKQSLNACETAELSAALAFEAEGQAACLRSPDFVEGVTAFMQKRKPSFGRTKSS